MKWGRGGGGTTFVALGVTDSMVGSSVWPPQVLIGADQSMLGCSGLLLFSLGMLCYS